MLWLESLWHSFLVNIAIRNVQALKTEILKIHEIYPSQPPFVRLKVKVYNLGGDGGRKWWTITYQTI